MRRILLFFTLLSINCQGQIISYVSKPGSTLGEDAYLASFGSSINYGNHPEFSGAGWTCNGSPCVGRGLIRFDLASIPVSATIVSARLNLYACTNPVNGNGTPMFGNNAAALYQVTSPWNESTVTFNNQPSYSFNNSVNLPQSQFGFQNYLSIDVENLVAGMVANPSSNFGFLLKLLNEQPFRTMIFASSDYSDPLLWPELEIEYLPSGNTDTCIVLSGNDPLSSDAFLASSAPTTNYGSHPEVASASWTCSGIPCYARGLMNFDFSSIPSGAVVTYASLDLYAYLNTLNGNGVAMQGQNSSIIQRVVSPWTESTVTWANQPSTVANNAVILAASTSSTQNYLNIDVTNLVNDIISSQGNSYGLMLKLINESGYTTMTFASSDNGDPQLSPKLQICYSLPTSISAFESEEWGGRVWPNPIVDGNFNLSFKLSSEQEVKFALKDLQGKQVAVFSKWLNPVQAENIAISLDEYAFDLPSGVYFLEVAALQFTNTYKLVVQ